GQLECCSRVTVCGVVEERHCSCGQRIDRPGTPPSRPGGVPLDYCVTPSYKRPQSVADQCSVRSDPPYISARFFDRMQVGVLSRELAYVLWQKVSAVGDRIVVQHARQLR